MQFRFRQFQIISLLIILGLVVFAVVYDGLVGTVLIILWVPVMFWLKTKVVEFKGLPFSKVVFASPHNLSGNATRSTGLGKGIDVWWHEPKRIDAADIWPRMAAYLIDAVIIVVVILITGLLTTILKTADWANDTAVIIILVAMGMVVLLYFFLRDGWHGQGIGKRIMHLQVVRFSTGQPCGYGRSALRYLCLRAFGIVELVIIFVQPNHRRIGDWASDTIVIHTQ